MNKELEIYLDKRIKDIKNYLEFNERSEDEKGFPPNDELQICYLAKEMLAIKNAEQSEALISLRGFKDGMITDNAIYITKSYFYDKFPKIENALLKAQVYKKAWEVIKEFQVDIWLLKQCDYENYIRIRKEALVSTGQIVNENGEVFEDEIPQQEFDFIKDVLEWID